MCDKEYKTRWNDLEALREEVAWRKRELRRDMLQDAIAWYGLPEDELVWEGFATGSTEWCNSDARNPAGHYVPRKD